MLKTLLRVGVAACFSAPFTATAGLVAFYDFNGNALDSSGNGNHATIVTAAQTSQGYEGQAYQFDGTMSVQSPLLSFIELPININPTVMPKLTMGTWVNLDRLDAPNNLRGAQNFISHDNVSFDRTIGEDTVLGASGFSAFGGPNHGVIIGPQAVAHEWVFIAARYDQAAQTVSLTVNDQTLTAAAILGPGLNKTYLGGNPRFRAPMQGRLDNVFFYDEFLSDARLEEIRLGGAEAIVPTATSNNTVPEPSTLLSLATALGILGLGRRKFRPMDTAA